MHGWLPRRRRSVFWTHTGLRVSARWKRSRVFSVTRMRESSRSPGAQKNGLRGMRPCAVGLVRPTHAARARPAVRAVPDLPGVRGPARLVHALPSREARGAGLPVGQPVLHPALCLLRGSPLPQRDHRGGGQGAAPGLGPRQGARQTVHEGAAGQGRHTGSQAHRHRRDLDQEAPHLPHRGQRPGSGPADLVWRRGSLGGEHGAVLRLAGPE